MLIIEFFYTTLTAFQELWTLENNFIVLFQISVHFGSFIAHRMRKVHTFQSLYLWVLQDCKLMCNNEALRIYAYWSMLSFYGMLELRKAFFTIFFLEQIFYFDHLYLLYLLYLFERLWKSFICFLILRYGGGSSRARMAWRKKIELAC